MNRQPLQILLVEDNAGDARLLREMFTKERPGSFELTHLLHMSDAVQHLAARSVDIVLLDLGLPDGHGLETVRRAHAVAPGVPLIVLTGLDDETLAAQAMKEGAQDYLIKGQIENRALPRALRHAIERHRMQMETDLIRTQQIRFKDEFLSHVSHELRSPLAAIYQFVTILLDRLAGDLQPQQQEYLEIVLRNVGQLRSMIDDLLEVTSVQAGKLSIDLRKTAVADAVVYAVGTLKGAAATKGVTLASVVEDQLPMVCADPTRLRQILVILIDNAIKFTPPGGEIKVEALSKVERDTSSVVLKVTDSGRGIAQNMTERIFERLFQASDPGMEGRKGLGLGLYICKELVTRQGGHISAQNAPSGGAVFSVVMPVFSLSNLIIAALGSDRRIEEPVSLVVTEVVLRTDWPSVEARTQHSTTVRDLLRLCLRSDRDALLPKIECGGAAELFFIVAAANMAGGQALSARISAQLNGAESLRQAGLKHSTACRVLAPIQGGTGESPAAQLQKMAGQIKQLINEEFSSRQAGAPSALPGDDSPPTD